MSEELKSCPFCGVNERWFPVMATGFPGAPNRVPWGFVAQHSGSADRNHGQTVERLAERGGLDVGELLAVIENRRWEHVHDTGAAVQKLNEYLDAFNRTRIASLTTRPTPALDKAREALSADKKARENAGKLRDAASYFDALSVESASLGFKSAPAHHKEVADLLRTIAGSIDVPLALLEKEGV